MTNVKIHSMIDEAYLNNLNRWCRKNPGVMLGKNIYFPLSSRVAGTTVIIKDGTNINGPFTIKGSQRVIIGKYCDIAEELYIITSNHNARLANLQADLQTWIGGSTDVAKGPVTIGNACWIGDRVTILPGVTVGDGAIIGAGSIVTKDIPAFAIAVGTPAKVIKDHFIFDRYRFPKRIRDLLIRLSWWHWDLPTIRKNKKFFLSQLTNSAALDAIDLSREKEITTLILAKDSIGSYLLDGWDMLEVDTRWMEKSQVGFILKTNNPDLYNQLILYGYSYHLPHIITLYINGHKIERLPLGIGWSELKFRVKNLKAGVNTIKILTDSPGYKPAEVEKKRLDKRRLYACFEWIKLYKEKT